MNALNAATWSSIPALKEEHTDEPTTLSRFPPSKAGCSCSRPHEEGRDSKSCSGVSCPDQSRSPGLDSVSSPHDLSTFEPVGASTRPRSSPHGEQTKEPVLPPWRWPAPRSEEHTS